MSRDRRSFNPLFGPTPRVTRAGQVRSRVDPDYLLGHLEMATCDGVETVEQAFVDLSGKAKCSENRLELASRNGPALHNLGGAQLAEQSLRQLGNSVRRFDEQDSVRRFDEQDRDTICEEVRDMDLLPGERLSPFP